MFQWLPFLSYVFVSTFTPGPNNILSMVNGNHYGFKETVKFLLGIASGFFLIMILSASFNLLLAKLIPRIQAFMEIIGTLYLLYLAYKIMASSSENSSSGQELNTFKHGLLLQFANPKVILYGLTLWGTFVTPYFHGKLEICFLSLTFASIALISTSCWALFGALFQSFLTRHDRVFRASMGILLIYSAVSVSGILRMIKPQ